MPLGRTHGDGVARLEAEGPQPVADLVGGGEQLAGGVLAAVGVISAIRSGSAFASRQKPSSIVGFGHGAFFPRIQILMRVVRLASGVAAYRAAIELLARRMTDGASD